MLSTDGVNLDERMLDNTLCVIDTKFMNLRTYPFTSWLYYFCWNSLTAWRFMPCHLCTALSTLTVLDSGISCSAVTSTPDAQLWPVRQVLSCYQYARCSAVTSMPDAQLWPVCQVLSCDQYARCSSVTSTPAAQLWPVHQLPSCDQYAST